MNPSDVESARSAEQTRRSNNQAQVKPDGIEDPVSGFIWRTFVGNKKKEDFFKSAILLLLIINGVLAFFLYNQKTQKSVYVIDAGQPKLASMIDSDVRVDEQIRFFLKLWTKLLIEINGDNYAENREMLKRLSSEKLMQRILNSESSSGNRLVKEVIQSETMRLRVVDIVIDEIERKGSLINVRFSEVIQIDVPDGSERYVTRHQAQIIPTKYSLNGMGLAMVDLDNLWKLERRTE